MQDILILQMIASKYPNTGTQDIKLRLFPFRIILELLLERQTINIDLFKIQIPYITNIDDLKNVENLNGEPYKKWKTCVIPYLTKFDILNCKKELVSISPN